MMPALRFVKMHGLGNDFIVIDGLSGSSFTPQLACKLCDRRFGIGADQVLWIKPAKSKQAIAAMEVINADGSPAEMCGNGIRAVAFYLDGARAPQDRKPAYLIETGAGLLNVEILAASEGERFARVEMGVPEIGRPERLILEKSSGPVKDIEFLPVSMGNPHAVIFVENAAACPLEEEGPQVERHSRFPGRTNVEFTQVEGDHALIARVWERGAGATLACGTGACAAAVAAIVSGRCRSPVEVQLPGGSLRIEWAGKGQPVFMSGPAVEVFRGEWSG